MVVRNRARGSDGPLQPYMLISKTTKTAYYYLVIDEQFIETGVSSIVCADLLLKSLFAFNLKYSPSLDSFNFLEKAIYRNI